MPVNKDTDLITENNVLGHCAVFIANDQGQAVESFPFLPSAYIPIKDVFLCFNHFMKKVNGT